MTSRHRIGLLALLGALFLAAGVASAAPAVPAPGREDVPALALARAAMAQRTGSPRGVIEALEPLGLDHGASFTGSDRAAFLLAEAYLAQGDLARFERLATARATGDGANAFDAWIAGERSLAGAAVGSTPAGHGVLDAGARLRAGDPAGARAILDALPGEQSSTPLALWFRALALAGAGERDDEALAALAGADTTTRAGRELAGLAARTLAARAETNGDDPRPWLERVPAGSRVAGRAQLAWAQAALARGDSAAARSRLAALVGDADPDLRRDALLALAGADLDAARWEDARDRYERADAEWRALRDSLESRLEHDDYATLWNAWAGDVSALALDATDVRDRGASFASRAADLRGDATPDGAAEPALATRRAPPAGVPAPPPAEWAEVERALRASEQAAEELERTEASRDAETARLADQRRYLGLGLDGAHAAEVASRSATARLDSLRARVRALEAQLQAVRDAAVARVESRVARVRAEIAALRPWPRGLKQLYLDGPDHVLATWAPEGYAGPDSVLAAEVALMDSTDTAAATLGADVPARIAESYARAWRPHVVTGIGRQDSLARSALAWSRALGASLDSSLAGAWSSETLRRLEALASGQVREADSLRGVAWATRTRVARTAVERAVAALDSSREVVDYGLAASAYARAVQLAPTDSASAAPTVLAGGAPKTDEGDALSDSTSVAWRGRAEGSLREFLQRWPRSFARGEMRFRLADLLLVDARQDFRAKMAAFTQPGADEHGPRTVPVMDASGSLALYRQMLAEDADFPHLDAVRFDAGMILADAGEPDAYDMFDELVCRHPQSAYAQEAWLRMGDMRFDDRRFRDAIERYAHAAAGADPTLKVIALYKTGWAHYNEDRFDDAAAAFGDVLDLYGSSSRPAIQVDIEGEASAYLVYSMAGAGGASAYQAHFARVGAKPYEAKTLLALGEHFRQYGEIPRATAVDQLFLERFPDRAEALTAATRMVETYRHGNRGAEESAARLAMAPRFAPGSAWARSQASDSLRDAGERFAHDAWRYEAGRRHVAAREHGDPADARAAIALDDTLLAHWPGDAEADTIRLRAAEAAASVHDWREALRRSDDVASRTNAPLAPLAAWERVAVSDAWYESSRPTTAHGATGIGDSTLARGVIDSGDRLRHDFPAHAREADVIWRQSQLALAHGWTDRALADLETIAHDHPTDARAPLAASERAEVLMRGGRYADAGAAFATALELARHAGADSLAKRAEQAMPVCAYRAVEADVAADSSAHAKHAEGFEAVARRWPADALAPVALYRAALARDAAGQPAQAARVARDLVQSHPDARVAREARLLLARSLEKDGDARGAAFAYAEFAQKHPDDESASAAWLKGADLFAASADSARADSMRVAWVRRHPEDPETAMELLAAMAERELARCDAAHPVSSLLDPAPVKGRPRPEPRSRLAEYLRLAGAHRAAVSRPLLAHVRFLQAEELQPAYANAKLTQPLRKSIAVRQRLLDSLLVRYRRCTDVGVPEWAHASAYRVGEALVAFGEALQQSERPADLKGDDLRAYADALIEQSRPFHDRGEGVWEDLLRRLPADTPADAWLDRARGGLWHGLANRFLFYPEADFPVMGRIAPGSPSAAGQARTSAVNTEDENR